MEVAATLAVLGHHQSFCVGIGHSCIEVSRFCVEVNRYCVEMRMAPNQPSNYWKVEGRDQGLVQADQLNNENSDTSHGWPWPTMAVANAGHW